MGYEKQTGLHFDSILKTSSIEEITDYNRINDLLKETAVFTSPRYWKVSVHIMSIAYNECVGVPGNFCISRHNRGEWEERTITSNRIVMSWYLAGFKHLEIIPGDLIKLEKIGNEHHLSSPSWGSLTTIIMEKHLDQDWAWCPAYWEKFETEGWLQRIGSGEYYGPDYGLI